MDAKTNLEQQYKELEAKNQANQTENLKAKVQLEETVRRIKSLIEENNDDFDLAINFDELSDKNYVKQVIDALTKDITTLRTEFNEELRKAREELGE